MKFTRVPAGSMPSAHTGSRGVGVQNGRICLVVLGVVGRANAVSGHIDCIHI